MWTTKPFIEYAFNHNLTVPSPTVVKVYDPSSTELYYNYDCSQYKLLKSTRSEFIRQAYHREFDQKPNLDPLVPPLWVHVRRSGLLHICYAFWRGDCPFTTAPISDAAVSSIVAKCIKDSGLDHDAVLRWFQGTKALGQP